MNISKIALLAIAFDSVAASDSYHVVEGQVEGADPVSLAYYSYNCYGGYYDYYYGYYESGCYGSNSTLDWGWFFLILICCPVWCWYRLCYVKKHHEQTHTTTSTNYTVNIDDNYQRAGDAPVQVNYNQNPQMMMQPQMGFDPNNPQAQQQQMMQP